MQRGDYITCEIIRKLYRTSAISKCSRGKASGDGRLGGAAALVPNI